MNRDDVGFCGALGPVGAASFSCDMTYLRDYWSSFYLRNSYQDSSNFCRYVIEAGFANSVIVEIGSGNGRDSLAFARANRRVLSFDFSAIALDQCLRKALELGLLDRVSLTICDVSESSEFVSSLRRGLGPPETEREPATF